MKNHLENRVLIVTGAAGGFGRLLAAKAAARGAKVVLADLQQAELESLAAEIEGSGGEAAAFVCDVTDRARMRELAQFAVDRFGAIDIMVNNAGVMPLAFYADHEAAAEAWDRCIDINLKGVLHGIMAVHDFMMGQGRGHIVNISSIYGNFPVAGAAVYGATKAAVNVLSDALRVESQGKIKVTTVKPTGVPGTGLGGGVINAEGVFGILGQNATSYMQALTEYFSGSLPAEKADSNHPSYWTISPDELTDQILYAMDQPWGISIGEITVRATGEEFVL